MNLIHAIKAIIIFPVWLVLCVSRKGVGTLYEETLYARPWTIVGGISFWTLVFLSFALLDSSSRRQILPY